MNSHFSNDSELKSILKNSKCEHNLIKSINNNKKVRFNKYVDILLMEYNDQNSFDTDKDINNNNPDEKILVKQEFKENYWN